MALDVFDQANRRTHYLHPCYHSTLPHTDTLHHQFRGNLMGISTFGPYRATYPHEVPIFPLPIPTSNDSWTTRTVSSYSPMHHTLSGHRNLTHQQGILTRTSDSSG